VKITRNGEFACYQPSLSITAGYFDPSNKIFHASLDEILTAFSWNALPESTDTSGFIFHSDTLVKKTGYSMYTNRTLGPASCEDKSVIAYTNICSVVIDVSGGKQMLVVIKLSATCSDIWQVNAYDEYLRNYALYLDSINSFSKWK